MSQLLIVPAILDMALRPARRCQALLPRQRPWGRVALLQAALLNQVPEAPRPQPLDLLRQPLDLLPR